MKMVRNQINMTTERCSFMKFGRLGFGCDLKTATKQKIRQLSQHYFGDQQTSKSHKNFGARAVSLYHQSLTCLNIGTLSLGFSTLDLVHWEQAVDPSWIYL